MVPEVLRYLTEAARLHAEPPAILASLKDALSQLDSAVATFVVNVGAIHGDLTGCDILLKLRFPKTPLAPPRELPEDYLCITNQLVDKFLRKHQVPLDCKGSELRCGSTGYRAIRELARAYLCTGGGLSVPQLRAALILNHGKKLSDQTLSGLLTNIRTSLTMWETTLRLSHKDKLGVSRLQIVKL
jgi:hypothetical protein